MSTRCFASVCLVILACIPALAQEKLYPIRGTSTGNIPAILTADRSAFAIERAFQHKLTLGFPSDDRVSFVPDTPAYVVMLWLRVQNTSQRRLDLNIAQFTGTDEQGRMYAALTAAQASDRIVEAAGGGSIGSKTLRGISLGRAGSKPTEEQFKEDIVRYSLPPGSLAPGAVKEGLIFFEGPARKKFTFTVRLGELWSQPLTFSTEKQK
jgi:hypothetical protein